MNVISYRQRRGELETYFDATAAEAWKLLTSDAPVSRIRRTVRAGRDSMRQTLLDWLPHDLDGVRILDAGCGTGAFAFEAAARGADVVAIDLAGTLVDVARRRTHDLMRQSTLPACFGSIDYRVGDMLDPGLGHFDHVVAMDSLIHYRADDLIAMLGKLCQRAGSSMVYTFAPRTPALRVMHTVGRLFPRHSRAPAIEPIDAATLSSRIHTDPALSEVRIGRMHRIDSGFYVSHAMELSR